MEEIKYIEQKKMIIFYIIITGLLSILAFINLYLYSLPLALFLSIITTFLGGIFFLSANGVKACEAGKSDVDLQKDYQFLLEKHSALKEELTDIKKKESIPRKSKNDKAIFYLLYEKVYKKDNLQSKNKLLTVINKELADLQYPHQIGTQYIYTVCDDEYIKLE